MTRFPTRDEIQGERVFIERKQDQGTGKLTEGIVIKILSSGYSHSHGLKVELENGEIGRVKKLSSIYSNESKFEQNNSFEDLIKIEISKTEDAFNEFKETFRFDTKDEQLRKEGKHEIADQRIKKIEADDAIRMEIPIAISAFGNSRGGKLFLGIKKDGTVIGLQRDMKKYNWKDEDQFGRIIIEYLRTIIKDEAYISSKLQLKFLNIDDKLTCIIQALPAVEPLYIHLGEKQDAYVRQPSAESKKIPMKDFLNYCKTRFQPH